MINTNPQVIYSKINANIEKIIGKIARQMLDLYPDNINNCLNAVSQLSETDIKWKIWRISKKLNIFDENEASNCMVESRILDLYDDHSSSDSLHSFDFRAAIEMMCILIYYTNKKISEYDA